MFNGDIKNYPCLRLEIDGDLTFPEFPEFSVSIALWMKRTMHPAMSGGGASPVWKSLKAPDSAYLSLGVRYSFHMFSSLRTTPHVVLDLKSYQHILGWLYLTQISVSNMFTALNLRFRRCCLEMMAWSLSNADRAQAGGLLLLLGFGWLNLFRNIWSWNRCFEDGNMRSEHVGIL